MNARDTYAIELIKELRKLGAVGVTLDSDAHVTCVSFASALVEQPEKEPKLSMAERLNAEEREELARYRERYQMDEELGNV